MRDPQGEKQEGRKQGKQEETFRRVPTFYLFPAILLSCFPDWNPWSRSLVFRVALDCRKTMPRLDVADRHPEDLRVVRKFEPFAMRFSFAFPEIVERFA
jgi:hypothetical protein